MGNQKLATGAEMHDFVTRLYPFCRSITGDGVRRTPAIVSEQIPLRIHEVPTGTRVLDWTVRPPWPAASWRSPRGSSATGSSRTSAASVRGAPGPSRGRGDRIAHACEPES